MRTDSELRAKLEDIDRELRDIERERQELLERSSALALKAEKMSPFREGILFALGSVTGEQEAVETKPVREVAVSSSALNKGNIVRRGPGRRRSTGRVPANKGVLSPQSLAGRARALLAEKGRPMTLDEMVRELELTDKPNPSNLLGGSLSTYHNQGRFFLRTEPGTYTIRPDEEGEGNLGLDDQ